MRSFARVVSLAVLASAAVPVRAGAGGLRRLGEAWDYKGFHIGDWPDKGYPLCAGKPAGPEFPHNEWQSPIDIPSKAMDRDSDTLGLAALGGGCNRVDMEHDGHTWMASFEGAGCANLSATWHGRNYTLKQLHFHFESENMLAGHHKDMEVHLVHQASDGSSLVIGVFLEHSEQNRLGQRAVQQDGFLHSLFRVGFMLQNVTEIAMMNPYAGMMSEGEEFYTYLGSLTTPPCTPNLEWIVLKESIPIMPQDLEAFEHYLSDASQTDSYGRDDRPVQPLNGRPVKIGSIGRMVG